VGPHADRPADLLQRVVHPVRHASYASVHWWPREFLAANEDLVRRINLRLGYRLQLVEATWPSEIVADSTFWFSTQWQNAGTAPCLPGG